MTITIREDGSLLVDGENNTVIHVKSNSDLDFKQTEKSKTNSVVIKGGSPNLKHNICRFVIIYKS